MDSSSYYLTTNDVVRLDWLRLAGKDSFHELLGKFVFYIIFMNVPRNVRDISDHLAAVTLSCIAYSWLHFIRTLALKFVILAIAAVDQVLRSINMPIYVHQIPITLEG